MMQAETWKGILDYLPPLILLFLLAFSPGLMRLIQKKILLLEERKKGKAQETSRKTLQKEEEIHLSGQSETSRLLTDSPYQDLEPPGTGRMEREKGNPALKRIDRLGHLQQAVIWSEILGPPGGKSL